MMFLLLLASVSIVMGSRLTVEQNDELQRECGKTYLTKRGWFRSMNTKPGSRNAAPFTLMMHLSLEDGTPEQRLATGEGRCTGTLISPRHVLTAAHCIADFQCKRYGSLFGAYPYFEENGIAYIMKLDYLFLSAPTHCQKDCDTTLPNLIVKPKVAYISSAYAYNGCGHTNDSRGDVAVLELEEDVPFSNTVQPACLHPKKVEVNTSLTSYGYGMTHDEKFSTFGIMRRLASKTISGEVCRTYKFDEGEGFMKDTTVKKDEMCTRSKKSMICGGDSGSGLILKRDKRAFVAAVTSWGVPCIPEEYSDIDLVMGNAELFPHLDWICSTTGVCPRGQTTNASKRYWNNEFEVMVLSKNYKLEPFKIV